MPERGAGTADVIPKPCDPASALKGVGPKKAALLSSVGVKTAEDLLYAFPRTYEDRRNKARIAELAVGEAAGFEGRVLSVPGKPVHSPKGGKVPFSVLVGDGTGTVELIFFNAKYMERIFAAGRSFRFFGVPQTGKGRLRVVHPDFERAEASGAQLSHPIMPVYPLTAGLTQKELRRWHEAVLPVSAFVTEYLPESLRKRARLCGISHALANIHFPADRSALSAAKYRLVFEELLLLQTGLMRIGRGRRAAGESGAKVLRCSCRPSVQAFEKLLPYSLTNAQRRTIAEIYADMETDRPMNRLVQGDVGSGKTAVAMAAIFKAGRNGFQALMMAPTEILAKQHYRELRSTFDRAGNAAGALRVALLTAGVKAAERRDVLAGLASGEIDVAVGTHALLRPDVIFARPGLVITDEQHRFGVNQRIGLSQKGEAPHVLVMTATPIPRTLAFILCGDLDISRIDEMPPGRKRILTKVAGSAKRAEVYEFLRGELARGRQAYVVAPLIEEGADAAGKPGE
ncbi:MAG: ATP-dependent DNA helicase RecG, partial [Clostridiales Family XIII bacterium]|nr:ATP-dependent DNA helicase RecG [Clostridiales Family XIII bacterium]